ncbi:hypothetical protein KY314_05235 [Candidatus Woesearchaeota archaeon]|nr:hypothetical protein [Candidatus Woesearchaeota archaeon]
MSKEYNIKDLAKDRLYEAVQLCAGIGINWYSKSPYTLQRRIKLLSIENLSKHKLNLEELTEMSIAELRELDSETCRKIADASGITLKKAENRQKRHTKKIKQKYGSAFEHANSNAQTILREIEQMHIKKDKYQRKAKPDYGEFLDTGMKILEKIKKMPEENPEKIFKEEKTGQTLFSFMGKDLKTK